MRRAWVGIVGSAVLAGCSAMLPGSDALTVGADDAGATDGASPAVLDDDAMLDAPATQTGDAGGAADASGGADASGSTDAGVDALAKDFIVQVSAGNGSACALTHAGSVWCWGSDERGQLGVVPTAESASCAFSIEGASPVACNGTPTEVGGLHDVSQIAAGNASNCAVENDGSVWCWGTNRWENLGHPSSQDTSRCGYDDAPCNPTPVQVQGLSARSVSLEMSNACAVTTQGEVACWGDGTYGQLGGGLLAGGLSTPQIIPGLEGVEQVVVQGVQVCALKRDGSVWCWGGQTNFLGIGHAPGTHGDVPCQGGQFCASGPMPVYQSDNATPAFGSKDGGGGLFAVDLTHGSNDGCVSAGGSVWCWGIDGEGVVGPADGGGHFYPTSVPLGSAAGLTASNTHACAIAADAGAVCWGLNQWGELGLGWQEIDAAAGDCSDGLGCVSPTPVPGLEGAIQVSAGFSLTVALKADHTVWAWGINDTGRLGHPPWTGADAQCTVPQDGQTYPCATSPVQVTGLP